MALLKRIVWRLIALRPARAADREDPRHRGLGLVALVLVSASINLILSKQEKSRYAPTASACRSAGAR